MTLILLILNCILIKNKIRSLYIHEYEDITIDTLNDIHSMFPELHVEKTSYLYEDKEKYDIFVSYNKLSEEDYDTDIKLGKLLGYPSAEDFPISNKIKNKGYYTYSIKVNLSRKNKVTLFSFVAKDRSNDNKIYKLLTNIQDSLRSEEVFKYIKDIYIIINKKRVTSKSSEIMSTSFIY